MYNYLNLFDFIDNFDYFFKFILQKPLSDTNFLHDMDKSTQEIITVKHIFFKYLNYYIKLKLKKKLSTY